MTAYGYPGWVRETALDEGDGTCPRSEHRARSRPPADTSALRTNGAATEAGIDCSGLVHMAYRATGRLVPEGLLAAGGGGGAVAEGEEKPGDLVTYGDGVRPTTSLSGSAPEHPSCDLA